MPTCLDLNLHLSHRSSASQPETSSPRTLKQLMTTNYQPWDRTGTNGISCEYTMPHEDGELEVHVTFGSDEKSDRSEIDEIVIGRPSNPTKTEANLTADADFNDSWNDYRDGGFRYMAPMRLYGYWVVKARSDHTDSSAVLHDLLKGNDFRSVLKNHMKWAIQDVRRDYPGRAVPPLPIEPHEKQQEVHSDNGGSDSTGSAKNSDEVPSHADTAGISSQYSGQPPESTLDTQVSVTKN